ncbi:MAG: hypothetical protein FWD29_10150, partial [Micrococcales bacterium]|nr:hypothetical protein [Micrococcales bacterium]
PDGPDKGTMVVTVEPPDQDPQIITVIVEYEDSTWKITEIVPDEPPASPSDPPETLPTDEEVLARLKEAKGIPDKWVCGDFDVDYEDTATLDDWVVYRVKDDRIKTLADFQDLAKPYFSERGIASMVRVFVLTDIDGRLYTGTDPNGCEGGPVDEQFTVQKHSDNRFDITIVSTFDGGGEPWAETTHVCYLWENGMWVFDDACDLAVDIVGTTWTNDSTEWASDYELNFGTDGLVTRVGYRNRDTGKYRVIDQSKIIASYDDNYWDSPGEGFVNSGSRYEETYIYGAANNTLSATTSGDDNSNAPDSIWYGFPGITHYFWW